MKVEQATIQQAIQVHAAIPEFDKPASTDYFENRYNGKEHVIFIAIVNGQSVGYLIGYDKFEEPNSFYCWMVGVIPEHRKHGALTAMMHALEEWCRKQGRTTLHIKTRNRRRGMLNYVVRNGWMFTQVDIEAKLEDNRLLLQKKL